MAFRNAIIVIIVMSMGFRMVMDVFCCSFLDR